MKQEVLDMSIDELIAQVEEHEMIEAPSYLKEGILEKAREYSIRKRKRELRYYSFKVCAGMAAAIVLIFSVDLDMLAQVGNNLGPASKVQQRQERVEEYREGKMKQYKKNSEKKKINEMESIVNKWMKLLNGGKNEK